LLAAAFLAAAARFTAGFLARGLAAGFASGTNGRGVDGTAVASTTGASTLYGASSALGVATDSVAGLPMKNSLIALNIRISLVMFDTNI
jgi:hypothetical protein